MSSYYCRSCQSHKNNDYEPQLSTGDCPECFQDKVAEILEGKTGRAEKKLEDARDLAADIRSKL